MRKNLKIYFIVFMVTIAFVLVFAGMNFVQAKEKPEQPPDKGKPPKITCNTNGICENGEYDSNSSPASQPCSDCLPKTYPPLVLNQISKQIVCVGRSNFPYSKGKAYQFQCVSGSYIDEINKIGEYQDTWASQRLDESYIHAISIGDADNDGEKEIVAVLNYVYEGGKGKNKWKYYDHKILMFKDGSDGTPEYSSDFMGPSNTVVYDTIIADVDNDGMTNELILAKADDNVAVYQWTEGLGFVEVWAGPDYGYRIHHIDVGDCDDDGENEIVLAMFDVGSVFILEYLGEDGSGNKIWSEPIYSEQITICEPSQTCKIDMVRIADADNDGENEIIAGGNNNRLMVWKYNSAEGGYDLVFVSENLGGCTQGVDVGDINGDGSIEVVIAAWQSEAIYVYEYSETNQEYIRVNSMVYGGGVFDLTVGDVDGDGIDEIVLYDGYSDSEGIEIYDFIGSDFISGHLQQTYYSPYGSFLEID